MKPMTEFAEEWIAAWNSHDLDRILSHYTADIVFTSPRAAARLPHTRGTVRGIEQLREYWAPLAEVRPHLKFTLERVLETVDGCTILYRDETGLLVAETMLIEAGGKVVQGIVSHAANPLHNKEGQTVLNEAITDLVCEVYRRVLGIEIVRPGDDFFGDLGGDSLSLAEVVSYIYDLLNVDIMEAMTTSTTPSSLALFIAPRLQQAGGQLRRQPSTSVAPQSLVQAAKRVQELADMNVDEVAPG